MDNPVFAFFAKTSLLSVFLKGGLVMWPLLVASILAQGTVIERTFFLTREQRGRDARALEAFFSALGSGDRHKALDISLASGFFVLRVLGWALEHGDGAFDGALRYAKEKEVARYRQGIPVLDTVITLAPLLGLLGTVTGMMGSFSLIGGELSTPGSITGGIAEALIATAFGLGIAISTLIPFNILNARMREAELEIESASAKFALVVNPVTGSTA